MTRITVLILLTATLAGTAGACAHRATTSTGAFALSERERAIHLLNRATFGARPEDIEEVLRTGRAAWIERQLRPEKVEAELPAAPESTATLAFTPIPNPAADSTAPRRPAMRLMLRGGGALQTAQQPTANKVVRAALSERQLEQVMWDFWFNHFNVYQPKRGVPTVLESYEETIRKNLFGRFEELLVATAQHPAMLIYLDNYMSALPAVTNAGEAVVPGPINENYARELLELHTLGVDGGYTQRDVIEVARAFTGWSVPFLRNTSPPAQEAISPNANDQSFRFFPEWHDRDAKVVLGSRLAPGRGIEDGLEVLSILAHHPSTARHLATKLARHFVADDPPAELVDEIARVFLETDGDLRDVTRALFTSESFYAREHYRSKIKRPLEFVVSALRVTGTEFGPLAPFALRSELTLMRHAPYLESAPTGYPTTAAGWLSHGAMLERMNFALRLSTDAMEYTGFAPAGFELQMSDDAALTVNLDLLTPPAEPGLPGEAMQQIVRRVLSRALSGTPSSALEALIVADLQTHGSELDAQGMARRALALAIGSPDFQRY